MHDREGLPDPDQRPTGEMAVPDSDDEPPPAPRSGAILAWGCLALLLAAGVAIYLAVR